MSRSANQREAAVVFEVFTLTNPSSVELCWHSMIQIIQFVLTLNTIHVIHHSLAAILRDPRVVKPSKNRLVVYSVYNLVLLQYDTPLAF